MSELILTCRICGLDFAMPEAAPLHNCPGKAAPGEFPAQRLRFHPCRGCRLPLCLHLRPSGIRTSYREDAACISQIQVAALRAEALCDPCDVFLCYKASLPGGPEGTKTAEYSHALTLYHSLTDRNYLVFFAHESLRQAAGAAYEAQIFHALQPSQVMLVICSDPEYLSTPWVRSEWSRFLERVDAREGCVLIPLLYDNCPPPPPAPGLHAPQHSGAVHEQPDAAG